MAPLSSRSWSRSSATLVALITYLGMIGNEGHYALVNEYESVGYFGSSLVIEAGQELVDVLGKDVELLYGSGCYCLPEEIEGTCLYRLLVEFHYSGIERILGLCLSNGVECRIVDVHEQFGDSLLVVVNGHAVEIGDGHVAAEHSEDPVFLDECDSLVSLGCRKKV